ncbi:hypothetical protein [Streptomyces sp. AF1A]|uniref:hypothetical protein n=1 Tax=Streptomyces sp. AF1A TaxID=3394350 RepID=UPI0039BD3F27
MRHAAARAVRRLLGDHLAGRGHRHSRRRRSSGSNSAALRGALAAHHAQSPRRRALHHEVDTLCGFLRAIGRRLGKPVVMTAEGDHGNPVLGFEPAADRVVLLADPLT